MVSLILIAIGLVIAGAIGSQVTDFTGFINAVKDIILAGKDAIFDGIGLLFILIVEGFNFVSAVFKTIPDIVSWSLFFITNFWLVFALIEIGIMGISMTKITFMEKISELFRLHYVIYGAIVRIFTGMIRMFISVLQTISGYIPFT